MHGGKKKRSQVKKFNKSWHFNFKVDLTSLQLIYVYGYLLCTLAKIYSNKYIHVYVHVHADTYM